MMHILDIFIILWDLHGSTLCIHIILVMLAISWQWAKLIFMVLEWQGITLTFPLIMLILLQNIIIMLQL